MEDLPRKNFEVILSIKASAFDPRHAARMAVDAIKSGMPIVANVVSGKGDKDCIRLFVDFHASVKGAIQRIVPGAEVSFDPATYTEDSDEITILVVSNFFSAFPNADDRYNIVMAAFSAMAEKDYKRFTVICLTKDEYEDYMVNEDADQYQATDTDDNNNNTPDVDTSDLPSFEMTAENFKRAFDL